MEKLVFWFLAIALTPAVLSLAWTLISGTSRKDILSHSRAFEHEEDWEIMHAPTVYPSNRVGNSSSAAMWSRH